MEDSPLAGMVIWPSHALPKNPAKECPQRG